MLIKLLQLLKKANKLYFGDCLQDIPVVITEEEKLTASSSSVAAHNLV